MAPTDSSVLITGETGVGKGLIARAIHNLSPRADGPFIPVNTSSVAEGLVASELFGHERGAFTGAIRRRLGRFELADRGTLFLDDVDNLSLDIQTRLLRALQEKDFERVGGERNRSGRISGSSLPPIRICRHSSERAVSDPDLYYRLNVFPDTHSTAQGAKGRHPGPGCPLPESVQHEDGKRSAVRFPVSDEATGRVSVAR